MAEEKQSVNNIPTQDSSNHRATKGERKFRKAMTKMGMKPVEGITRVTLKTNKNVRKRPLHPPVQGLPPSQQLLNLLVHPLH